jgi:hypothetical protein
MSKPGAYDNGYSDAECSTFCDDLRHGRRWRRDDKHIGRSVKLIKRGQGPQPADLAVMRIDDVQLSFKTCCAQICEHDPPKRILARAAADQCDGAGIEKSLQAMRAHLKPAMLSLTEVSSLTRINLETARSIPPLDEGFIYIKIDADLMAYLRSGRRV